MKKTVIISLISAILAFVAGAITNTASFWILYQPKVPKKRG